MTEWNGAKFIRRLSACALGHRSSCAILNTQYLVYSWHRTYEAWIKKFFFLSRDLIVELKLFESAILSPPWPDFYKKSSENRSNWPKKKSGFYLIFFFQIKPIMSLIDLVTFFRVEYLYLITVRGSWVIRRNVGKIAKNLLYRKRYNSETKNDFWFIVSYVNFKTGN